MIQFYRGIFFRQPPVTLRLYYTGSSFNTGFSIAKEKKLRKDVTECGKALSEFRWQKTTTYFEILGFRTDHLHKLVRLHWLAL